MAGGEVLRFPRPEKDNSPEKALAFDVREPAVVEKFELEQVQNLLVVAQKVSSGCKALLEFIHVNRDLSKQAGIETIAVEVVAILEGDRFERLLDALEDGVVSSKPVHLSIEGLSKLRRMETLLAEASNNINRFTQGGHRLAEASQARSRRDAERRRLQLQIAEKRLAALRDEYQ